MKIKRIIASLLLLAFVFAFTSCSAGEKCQFDVFAENFRNSEEPTAYVYDEEKLYDISDYSIPQTSAVSAKPVSVLLSLMPTSEMLVETGSLNRSDKLLTVTIDMQYEMTFFENGGVMIYHGVCGVFEKDRQYYEVSSDYDVGLLIDFIKNNFSVSESEEQQ